MDNVKSNIAAICVSITLVLTTLFIFKADLIQFVESSTKDAPLELTEELENGVITIFGSSELTSTQDRFIPVNFFNDELNIDLKQHGHAFHQSFAILAQLATYYNDKVKNNGKIVIFLSPGWFATSGTNIDSFLEYMTPNMLNQLYFNSPIDPKFKLWVSEYLTLGKLNKINNANLPIYYASAYKYWNFHNDENNNKKNIIINTDNSYIEKSNINWKDYRTQAEEIEKTRSTSNSFGINDQYYNLYVKDRIEKGKFPFPTKPLNKPQNNQEYQDFLKLVELCKLLKIKPLFIMQDLNPYAYKNLDNYNEILTEVKTTLVKNDFPYLDMWSWNGKSDYQIGKLKDVMHTGESGWVDIDQFIYKYFSGEQND